ncbi:hypothetical protein SGRA_2590 [Saprospira grandis str. Lewin]|uniref:Uncharacterized protein n=1 Tax=Saprospira grandis (strain Lewin) TaxID=984262 RepID=H6L6S2_SAPGL|nr:hypothetical protein SGRA_2590 [Saprospira grandis str. Lewin]
MSGLVMCKGAAKPQTKAAAGGCRAEQTCEPWNVTAAEGGRPLKIEHKVKDLFRESH